MGFKEDFNKGNNFILSPNGKISRRKYFLYAFLLDALFRIINATGIMLINHGLLFFLIFLFLLILIATLKIFNYKKRAYSFLNNNIGSYLYSVIYISLGFVTQLYLHFLQISTKKSMYNLTHDDTFLQYANVYVPSFIGSNIAQFVFYTLCGIGFIMFLLLIAIPTKDAINESDSTIQPETIDKVVENKTNHNKQSIYKKVLLVLVFSMCIIGVFLFAKASQNMRKMTQGAGFVKGLEVLNTVALEDYCSSTGYVPNNYINKFKSQFSKTILNSNNILKIHGTKKQIKKEVIDRAYKSALDTLEKDFNYFNTQHGMSKKQYCQFYDEQSEAILSENMRILKRQSPNVYRD